jgi:hypothetical protein
VSATTTATGNSFVQRAITVSLTLATGSFANTGSNTVTLSGLRVACSISKAAYPSFDKAEIRVYGVPQAIMNQVSTLGIALPAARPNYNTVVLQAGDATNGLSTVFQGYIANAWADYNATPETFLNIVCWVGVQGAMNPTKPLSFTGQTDVATVMAGIAASLGYAFENGGVQTQISNVYLPGTAMDQAHALARMAGINLYFDSAGATTTLCIWPKNLTRANQLIPLISAASGLIGYPAYRDQAMQFRCIFNPNIRIGGQIQMQSSVGNPGGTGAPETQAGGPNGYWYVIGPLIYDLSAQIPDGPFFTDVKCSRLNQPPQ